MEELREVLELDQIKTHHWQIVACSAVTGDNLLAGVDWCVDDISRRSDANPNLLFAIEVYCDNKLCRANNE